MDKDSFLIIRADANERMGTGHVMRCIALAQAWQDAGGAIVFVSCCDSDVIQQRLVDEGFGLVKLSAAYPESENDLKTTLETAQRSRAKWIATDGYHFNLSYQQAIRRAGFRLLCIDDYNHLPEYESDILLNQNICAEELDYHCNSESLKLLGIKYVMLRREFRLAERIGNHGPMHNILITMGGSDPDNSTLRVLDVLTQLNMSDLCVKVIVGPSNPHYSSLQQFIASSGLDIELISSVRDMPALMKWADFAISAAGSTCWELAALKVPFITLILAENQEKVALKLEKHAHIPCMGWANSEFEVRFVEFFKKLTSLNGGLAEGRSSCLVDRSGVDRVLRASYEVKES